MATNAPDEEIILVRGSAEYKDYIRHQFGWLKNMVNGFEDALSISGRWMLLLFILYTTIDAVLTLGNHAAPWWADAIALGFQVCGLEGAIPGLARLRETLLAKKTQVATDDAETVRKAIKSARVLNMLTGVELFLAAYGVLYPHSLGGLPISITDISRFYGYVLLMFRLWKITEFITAMARMETKRPKVISQAEHERLQKEQEQEQTHLDNASIQASISQAMDAWEKDQEKQQEVERLHMQAMIDAALNRWTSQQNQEIAQAIQQMQNTPACVPQTVPQIDNETIIAGVVGQFETRFTSAMKRFEVDVKQSVLVSLANETQQNGTHGTGKNGTGETQKGTMLTGPRLVSLPQRTGSVRPAKPTMEPITGPQEAVENPNYKATIYHLLTQDNTAQVPDLVRQTGIAKTTVWRHWNRYHEEHGTRGQARVVSGETDLEPDHGTEVRAAEWNA